MSAINLNPWFGQVPDQWQRGQLKRFYSVRLGKMLQPNSLNRNDMLVPYMRAANISWAGPDISDVKEMWASPEGVRNNLLEVGDLLVSEGGDVGRSCLWNGEIDRCIFQNAINRVRSRNLNSTKYLRYVMEAVKGSGWIDIICNKATIAHFTAEKVNSIEIPLPPLTRQHSISAYLEEQTAKIDRLIALRRRQMQVLKEQRAALIQQALTRGLNPNAPMRDSGIPWLGEIPTHWQTTRLAHHTTRIGDGLHGTPEYINESPFRFINGNNLSGGTVIFTSTTGCVSEDEFKKHQVALGKSTLLMSINGTVGSIAYYEGESIILGKSAAYINCAKGLSRRYLFHFLQSKSAVSFFQLEATGTTIFNLSLAAIRNLPIILPSLSEQNDIIDFIEIKCAKLDAISDSYARQITVLAEYRSALIHECVTGQRQVPELVLPIGENAIPL
jgi:type I restriction enzyme, S subunit